MFRGTEQVVGRERELAAVDDLLTTASSRFAVVVLEGVAGIGKTTVWHEAIRRAAARRVRVISTRPTEAEVSLSLAGLGDLFGAVDDSVKSQLPPPQRDALAAALLQAPAPEHGIDERALSAAVLSVLRLLSQEGPLLVAVDDAQWLDTSSSRALSFAVRRLDREPIACLAAVRAGAVRLPTFDRAADASARVELELGPLSVAALHEAVKQRTGRSLARPVIVQLSHVCGGNPFYVLEAAKDLSDSAIGIGRIRVPDTLVELLVSRIKSLPATTRRALLITAMLSRPELAQVDAAALGAAVRAGVVAIDSGHVRFTHPLFASAIQRHAGELACRSAHRHLAAVLTEPEERARHAALGAEAPNAAIVAELGSAAALAGSRGAPAAAAELLELAVNLTPASEAGGADAARVAAAASWFDAGDLARAQSLLEDAMAGQMEPRLRATALHLLGQMHARRSSFGQALAAAQAGLEAAVGDAALRAELEMDIAYYGASVGDMPTALTHANRAVDEAGHAGAPGLLGDALAAAAMCGFLAGAGIDEARILRARELEDPWRSRAWQMRPAFIHGHLLLYTGRAAEAREVLASVHAEAVERGEESQIPFSCFWLTWACIWCGDFAAARRRVDEARQTAPLLDEPAASGMALLTAALLHAHDGSIELARQEASEAAALFGRLGWNIGVLYALWAAGLAELSAGRPELVDAALGELAAQITSLPGGDPVVGACVPIEVEALVELGQSERAGPMLQWLEERAAAVDRPWARAAAARCRALVRAALGDNDAAVAQLDVALAQHARTPIPFERARTLLVAGQVHRRRKEKRLAADRLGEALLIFEDLGATAFAARAKRELARLGRRPATTDALTDTELRVAELAASGLANRQIADRAFLTTKAVEGNLTRVYRKLGIRSRAALARALQHAGETGAIP
ncbi:MAG: helix-turn-helix domain-containing protein [Candidatus Dormibacteraeota bacterium]|nr:helix-turn-helix domain-containing protein [Candidatus Dormibacteraeota bacterium]